jgi:hypothetical protein
MSLHDSILIGLDERNGSPCDKRNMCVGLFITHFRVPSHMIHRYTSKVATSEFMVLEILTGLLNIARNAVI